jgi:radical SAM superfamily enzyme YgiQ (UPF0313 family)
MSSNNHTVVLFGDSKPKESRPIGIYVLASYLRQHNIPTQAIWGWNQDPYYVFYGMCKKFLNDQIKVVGISSTLLSNPESDEFNFFGLPTEELYRRFNLIKKLAPNAKIVVGGSQTIYSNLSNVPGAEFVDLFIHGQGEQALLEFVRAVDNNTKITTASITPPTTSDKIYKYDDFTTTPVKFDPSDCLIPGEAMAIEFARGCIFKCSFCSYELNGKSPGDYIKSKETLREELLYNYNNFGTTYYYSSDDLINDSEGKVDMILEVSQSLPFKLTYSGYLRLDLIRRFPAMAKKLKDSGLISAFFGIETINDASGRAVGKGLGLDRTNEALEICDQAWNNSVAGTAGMIIGLPKDTPEYKYQLLEWITSSSVRRVIKDCDIKPLFITPGLGLSDIDKNPEKFGYRNCGTAEVNARYGLGHMNWETDCYSLKQAIVDSKFVKNKFYENNTFKFRLFPFKLPYVLSLADNPAEILNIVFNDSTTQWTDNKDWNQYLHNLHIQHRKQYITTLLK